MTFEEWTSHRFPAGFENWDGNLQLSDLEQAWNAALEKGHTEMCKSVQKRLAIQRGSTSPLNTPTSDERSEGHSSDA